MPLDTPGAAVYANTADHDGMWDSGMEGGARETYDRFDELLAEIQRKTKTG